MRPLYVALLLCLTGCGGGSGGSSASAVNGTSPLAGTSPTPIPIDYNSLVCQTMSSCAATCGVAYPYLTANEIQTVVCDNLPTIPQSACNTIIAQNASAYAANSNTCLNSSVATVLDAQSIFGAQCSSILACANTCSSMFPVQSDTAIKNAGGVTGATLTALYNNHINRTRKAACLAAPSKQIVGY